jgi:hypothetical protein
LQALVNLPIKNNDEVIAFFTSDIVREYKQPVMQAGHKEGYLTKRGKNFGGWKTRFFVLQGPVLEYYDCVRVSSFLINIVPTSFPARRRASGLNNRDRGTNWPPAAERATCNRRREGVPTCLPHRRSEKGPWRKPSATCPVRGERR